MFWLPVLLVTRPRHSHPNTYIPCFRDNLVSLGDLVVLFSIHLEHVNITTDYPFIQLELCHPQVGIGGLDLYTTRLKYLVMFTAGYSGSHLLLQSL